MSERKVRFSVRFYAGNARYQSGNVLNLGGVLRGPENRPSERRLRGGAGSLLRTRLRRIPAETVNGGAKRDARQADRLDPDVIPDP